MKKIYIFIFVCLLFSSLARPAWAHMLKTDKTIGAVIHLDPDDDPIVGQPSAIYFELKDKSGKFTPTNCDCLVSIKQNDEILSSFPLYSEGTDIDLSHAATIYTFPQRGIYTIVLDGKPKSDGQFNAFSISYDVRVERVNSTQIASNVNEKNPFSIVKVILFAILAVAIACMIIFIWYKKFISIGRQKKERSV